MMAAILKIMTTLIMTMLKIMEVMKSSADEDGPETHCGFHLSVKAPCACKLFLVKKELVIPEHDWQVGRYGPEPGLVS